MYKLVLIALLLVGGCRGGHIGLHLLDDLDNIIEPNVIHTNEKPRKFLAITTKPSAIYAHEPGTTVELICEATAAPAPSVRWFKNDEPVYEYDIESNEIVDSSPTSLGRIKSTLLVPKTIDKDRYTCLVTAGSMTKKTTSTVYRVDGSTDYTDRSKLVPLAPRILVHYKVYMDTIGSRVVLPCRVKGHPRPRVIWKNSEGVIKDPRMKVLRSGELVISHIRWSDMGDYSCHAFNTYGKDQASTFLYPTRAG